MIITINLATLVNWSIFLGALTLGVFVGAAGTFAFIIWITKGTSLLPEKK